MLFVDILVSQKIPGQLAYEGVRLWEELDLRLTRFKSALYR